MGYEFQLLSLTGAALLLVFFLAGFVDAVCGGGGLLTVPAMLVAGIPTGLITGTNQCATIIGNFTAMGRYMKSGNICYRAALVTTPFAIGGALLGSRLNLLVPEKYLQLFMLAMIPILAAVMLLKRDVGSQNHMDTLSSNAVMFWAALIGLVLGTYQGFYGPGAGMLFGLAYMLLVRLDCLSATASTRFVVAFASVSAGLSYALSNAVIWPLAASACVLNILGSYVGAGFAIRFGGSIIRPMMLAVIALLFLRILFSVL